MIVKQAVLTMAFAFLFPLVAAAQAGPGRAAIPDHWLTADSLANAVGGDHAVAIKIASHVDAVDSAMASAAAERRTMREHMQSSGGARPDMSAMRTKMDEYQKQIDTHVAAIRSELDAKQQVAFDKLSKPNVRPMRMGGRAKPSGHS